MARLSISSSLSSKQNAAYQASGQTPASEGETIRRTASSTEQEKNANEIEHDGDHDHTKIHTPFTNTPFPYDPSLLPKGKRSLSVISSHSFWLGFVLAASLILGVQAAYQGHTIWRIFAFSASLSLFHFLEFWTTATFNLPQVRASSFLLFSNGTSYNLAHGLAILEIFLSNFLFPKWQALYVNNVTIALGLFLVIFGQIARTTAMATAGTNFNHTPQKNKAKDHELVTSGIYAYSRHPSYFAFFWWAVGTQILVGNKICFVAFVVVLWMFFKNRIACKSRRIQDTFSRKLLTTSLQPRSFP
jgi:protein-S-isoprenylcysteine O-methyltransferase